jgi:hypothetical protein
MPLIRRLCPTESPNNSNTCHGHAPFLCVILTVWWSAYVGVPMRYLRMASAWKSWLGNGRPVEPNPADDPMRVGRKVEASVSGNQQASALDIGPWASRSRTEWALLAGAGRWDCRLPVRFPFLPLRPPTPVQHSSINRAETPRRRTFPPHGVSALPSRGHQVSSYSPRLVSFLHQI